MDDDQFLSDLTAALEGYNELLDEGEGTAAVIARNTSLLARIERLRDDLARRRAAQRRAEFEREHADRADRF